MKALAVLLFLYAGAAHAQVDACMKAYNDEVTAIEREAKAKQEVGSNAAKQRAARSAETRMEAAARLARKCQEEARAKPTVASAAKPVPEDECKAKVNARMVELERRFSGAALDPAQQNLRRDEEVRLQAELNQCRK